MKTTILRSGVAPMPKADNPLAPIRGRIIASLTGCVARALEWLTHHQYATDAGPHYRGEFPMQLYAPSPRLDHNFLTGYTLLHLAMARTSPAISPEWRQAIAAILDRARDIPRRYRGASGLTNWYHGKLTRCGAPPDHAWTDGVVLCLCDDYDDTSIASQLACLAGYEADPAMLDRLLAAATPADGGGLGYRSLRRTEAAGVQEGVYRTWKLPPPDPEDIRRVSGFTLPVRMVPHENSVEMVTAANIWTAIALLDGDAARYPSQAATAVFVNRLARQALTALLDGDPGALTVAAPYYPWVPFAPVAFLLHDHCVAGATLLDAGTRDLIGEALAAAPADHAFVALAYWLNCAAWSARAGCLPEGIEPLLWARWLEIQAYAEGGAAWPDFIFFNQAHIGHYGGPPYVQALMLETALLLLERAA